MINVDLDKAKVIAHERRRAAREEELSPLDGIICKQIPGTPTEQIEAQRQVIRDKYVSKQNAIDAASTVAALKEALNS